MQPGFDLRLRTMMKALSEVVLPAVDPANRAAVEQGSIVLGSLDLLLQQVDYAHWYEVVDLLSLCNLARELSNIDGLGANPKIEDAASIGVAIAARWDVSLSQIRQSNLALRDAIGETAERAFTSDQVGVRTRVQALVLSHSEEQIGRERAYVAGTKWDIFPESLQTIEASLARASTEID